MSVAPSQPRLLRRHPRVLINRARLGAAERLVRPRKARSEGCDVGLTLDDLISGAWEALSAHETSDCPLCGGKLTPSRAGLSPRADAGSGAHRTSEEGPYACMDCGTHLE